MRLCLAVVLVPAVALASEPRPVTFDPTAEAPYFSTGPAAAAAADLRLEDWNGAATGFATYLKTHAHARDAKQAMFLQAYAELKAGKLNDAATHFDGLVKAYPLLVDYERVFAARAHLAAGRATLALDRVKRVPPESALDGEARFLRGEAERAAGHTAEAAAGYRSYLEGYPTGWRAPEARFRLAEALDALGQGEAARTEWRTLYLDDPTDTWGRQAAAHLGAAPTFTAPEIARRAMALFDAMQNAASETEWKRVLGLPGLDDKLTCVAMFHGAQSVFKARQRWRAAPLFDAAVEACTKAKDEDLLVKSLYQGARSWGQKGLDDLPSTQKAAAMFEKVWREHPQHSYADDARIREAELYDGLKDEAKSNELLVGLPVAFAAGDQKGEALWRLAFHAWRKGDTAGAGRFLEQELTLLPREDGWWEAGRTLYWLGRVADRKGDPSAAADLYARSAREYPLSYYALQSLNRLHEKWPDRADKLIAELKRSPAGDDDAWRFKARSLYGEPAFKRGVELARLGLGAEAKRELALAGIEVPKKRGALTPDPEREELLWLAAVLYDRAGEYAISHFIPRYLLTSYDREWPTGANRKRWLLSYPRGYRDLIEKHAALNGQPASLELAIVREESGFDPLMESFANAIGLTQLTGPPAARFAQGLPHDAKALRDPAINVTIGARELGQLWGAYAGAAALAIAGYNAGEGAVNKWMRDPERAGMTLDEFVEAIPYDETRGYTKRVLASFFAYSWLYDGNGTVPPLPLPMPPPPAKHR
ncbi:MAG TPA: transglycosylase SLT domain-containing protein [Polyangia bacterium]|nr:transglycosylase SLT domain-containing protein [Polyangia bacterium]